jgi:hypothetical protein
MKWEDLRRGLDVEDFRLKATPRRVNTNYFCNFVI